MGYVFKIEPLLIGEEEMDEHVENLLLWAEEKGIALLDLMLICNSAEVFISNKTGAVNYLMEGAGLVSVEDDI